MDYRPPAPRVRHTEEVKRKIALTQHMRKVYRIAKQCGLEVEEVGHKLALGLGYCSVHGWKPWARCRDCKKDYKRRTKGTRASALISRMREQKPELAGLVKTGAEMAAERQLDLPFWKGPRTRQ